MGPQRAAALARVGTRTVEDLLLHLPLRYEDRRQFTRIRDLRPGVRTAVRGRLGVAGLRRARRTTVYEVRLEDGSGRLKALWFNQPFLREALPRGADVVLYGLVEEDPYARGQLVMSSPQHEVLTDDDSAGLHVGRIVPVYEKLGSLTTRALRRVLLPLAEGLPDDLPDPLPADVREILRVVPRGAALRGVHAPAGETPLAELNAARSPAHRRLILEEFFLFQLGLALRRRDVHVSAKGPSFSISQKTREAVKRILPFHLTGAQKRVLREIADDMRSPHPMNRLVQGDVGSGKTMVALLAMVVAVDSGWQAAFMAPTEILAEQHYLTFRRLLAHCPYRVDLLTSARKGREKAEALRALAAGETQIAVGTHALIQEAVRFFRLGLVVVDEQHRFGVRQRDELRRKGCDAEVLVMTATPIPRTLALTAYGDLDVSVVDERPPGRSPVRTERRRASERSAVEARVRAEAAGGGQVFVVYPLVEESLKLEEVQAATQMAEEWARALPGARVALLHGRMKSAEKEEVMTAFAAGSLDVLVATTVIEVGVDVPNAALMVVEHAERFGLAQLHQLRGRVGRGNRPSTCILVSHGRLSPEAEARLQVMVETDDGFVIGERDLEIRGPGDFFGTRQWGAPTFRVGHLLRDRELLETARQAAFAHVEAPAFTRSPLRHYLAGGEWDRRFGLARVG